MTDLYPIDDYLDEDFNDLEVANSEHDKSSPEYLGLNDFEGLDTSDKSGFCMTWSAIKDFNDRRKEGQEKLTQSYEDWEQQVARPFFVAQGYTVGVWIDGEWDSFGPLSRRVSLEKEGKKFIFVYG